jgi:glycosyltransferase involved in cell wall biosynthesis
MKRKINVLHIINSLQQGGAETLLVNSLSGGGLQEYTNNILVYFQSTSILEEKIDKDIKVYDLGYKGLFSLPGTLLRLKKIIKEHNIDIVHSHLNPASTYAHLACPKNIPQVHTLHITYSQDFDTRPILKYIERIMYFKKRRANIIFLSDFTKEDFLKTVKFKGHSFVLNNFIEDIYFNGNVNEYDYSSAKGLKLIAVGYLRPQKNYLYLLEIFKHLKNYNIQVDIYGGGDTTSCQKIIDENNLKIKFMGAANNINEIIKRYDLFIMSSANEGFPLSVFEAMAAGVPVMLSNIKPLTSIVKEHAVYFDLDNAEKAAQQLVAILHGQIEINKMAYNAKTYAGQTVRRGIYIDKLLKIYDKII